MSRHTYDVILAGGGAAGLSLAYQLSLGCPNLSMLIVDEQVKDRNDHTWCYWSAEPSYLDGLAYRSWDRLAVRNRTTELRLTLAPYRYHMVRSIDFYRFMKEKLTRHPDTQFLRGTIRDISEMPGRSGAGPSTNGGAEVVVNGIAYRGTWVFDSRYRADEYRPLTRRHHYMVQHFMGWDVETEGAIFDPETPTLFDFRTHQDGTMRFFYILPFTERRGLVEYTIFSDGLLPLEAYRRALHNFLTETLAARRYRVLDEERDLIPMTDHRPQRQAGPHVLNIGTRGGRVKPSSGYAFYRIHRDSVAIARSLAGHGHLFDLSASPRRYQAFDAMLLHILHRYGDRGAPIFMQLFRRNPVQRIFRFLDEEAGLWENLKLMASVPPWPFIRAWLAVNLLRLR